MFKTGDVVAAEIVKDCKICFDVKNKPPDLGTLEAATIAHWRC